MDLTENKNQKTSMLNQSLQKSDNQSQYSPYGQKICSKRIRKQMKSTHHRKRQKPNSSTWSLQENLLYKQFLKNNPYSFEMNKEERRTIKINVLISQYVRTRTPEQCRSHHQKMLIYHGTIHLIVTYIESLQMKQPQIKVPKQITREQLKKVGTPTSEMKEINEVVNLGSPSLWDCMIQDVWINI